MPRQLPAEVLQVRALPLQLIDNLQHPRRVALLERRRHLLHRVLREHAQQRPHLSRVQRRPAAGNRLVERRQRIPHRPLAHLRNHGQSLRLGRNPFLAADPLHPLQQLFKIHAAKRKLLAPRRNRRRNLMRLGRAQDKHHPLGRLLERLQQRVKRFVGNLMRLVDDENFVAVSRRPVPYALAQLPHLVNAAVGRRVDLDHIHRAARRNLLTARAHPAWIRRRPFDAVQKTRHQPRHRCLARPALAAENVAVRNAPLRNRVIERGLDVFLTHQFRERLRPVLARDDLIHAREKCQAPGDPRHTD